MNQMAQQLERTTLVSESVEGSDNSKVWRVGMSQAARRISFTTWFMLLALMVAFAGCNKTATPSQTTFASPDDAGNGLLAAAKTGDINPVLAIFGTDSKDIISSGDAVQDKATVGAFVTGYQQMHRWRKMPDGSQILLIGADNFPFPIPLKKNDAGQWFFDTAAGKDEILRRRIGRNELAIIDILGHWVMLKPTTIHGYRAVPGNTLLSSSVTLASRTACTGSHQTDSLRARSGLWRLTQPPKDIPQNPMHTRPSTDTTSAC